jgi:aspartyl-tRNA(Asn)/glutamyl-tRNA(Gln) amidotransferase subunit A
LPDGAAAGPIGDGLRGLRIGVPRSLLSHGVDAEVTLAFDAAIAAAGDQGAEIVEVALPHSAHAIPVYYLVATAEASSNLARYDGVRYGFRATDATDTLGEMYDRTRERGFGPEVKRRIILGTYVLSAGYKDAYYLKAQQVRTLIRRDYDAAFEHVDVIAMPTSPTAAFPLGERISDPVRMYLADVFTVGANLAGVPSISVPCGLTSNRLPIGVQLTGPPLGEATLLRAAAGFERAAPVTGAPLSAT